jgi:hypothetical protein
MKLVSAALLGLKCGTHAPSLASLLLNKICQVKNLSANIVAFQR